MNNLPIKIESKEEILQKYSVHNSIRIFRETSTALQAFKTESLSLATLKKEHGEQFSLTIIRIWITSLNDFVNTARKLNPAQIDELSIYIYDDYYYFNMADLYLITKRIKSGYYGNLFESLDGMKILSFFRDYAYERSEAVFGESCREHDMLKYTEEKILNIRKK